jgi:hypothetical protein
MMPIPNETGARVDEVDRHRSHRHRMAIVCWPLPRLRRSSTGDGEDARFCGRDEWKSDRFRASAAGIGHRLRKQNMRLPMNRSTSKEVLQRPGERTTDVYFPEGGFCSILTALEDRSLVEIATVGREGMVGILAILDVADKATSLTMVQAATQTCYRMSAEDFRGEMDRRSHGNLRR